MSKNPWFEKPDSSSITVNQHVFPKESIRRFCGRSDGKVGVYLKEQRKIVRAGSRDKTFCAKRVWDQKAESGPLSEIENRYQALAAAIVSGRVRTLQPWDQVVVTEMYGLWRYRALFRSGMPDVKANLGGAPQPHLRDRTKQDEEAMELGHVCFFREDGTFPARQMIGIQLVVGIDRFMEYAAGRQWGIVRANTGEFIVPDTFGSYTVLPLSPDIVLALDHPDAVFDSAQVSLPRFRTRANLNRPKPILCCTYSSRGGTPMSTQQNIELVKQFYDAYLKGQKDLLLSYMTDDIDWNIPEMDGLAFSGRRRGREEVSQFFGAVSQVQQLRSFEPQEFFGDGNRVVVLGHHEWIVKSSGTPFDSDWVHIFTIRDGRIAAFRQSMDTLKVAQAHQAFPVSTALDAAG